MKKNLSYEQMEIINEILEDTKNGEKIQIFIIEGILQVRMFGANYSSYELEKEEDLEEILLYLKKYFTTIKY